MSQMENSELMERANEMLEEWTGTTIGKAIQVDLDRSDLESLYAHVCVAEGMLAQQEFENADIY